MAIYNADEVMNRLNEQEVEEYDALDNLVEACDAMMDMLNERNAYDKYDGMLNDKRYKLLTKAKKYSELADKTVSSKVRDKMIDKQDFYLDKADEIPCYNDKREWMRDHGDRGEDELGNRKPGTFKTSEGLSKDHEAKDQKKKAIKETCLYILSVIDEM